MIPIKYYIQLDDMGLSAIAITARSQGDGTWKWLIEDWHDPGTVFSKSQRKFIDNPMPSNREDDYFEDTRFASSEEALAFWNKGKS